MHEIETKAPFHSEAVQGPVHILIGGDMSVAETKAILSENGLEIVKYIICVCSPRLKSTCCPPYSAVY